MMYKHCIDPMKLRLIFLDVDGVLNSLKTYIAHGTYPMTNDYRDHQTDTEPYILDAYAFDQASIKLVNLLVKSTNAHIVISSTWRIPFNLRHTIEMFKEMGIDSSRIIGRTDQGGDSRYRGLQINRFLNRFQSGVNEVKSLVEDGLLTSDFLEFTTPLKIQSYVIIDDLDDYYEIFPDQKPWLIHTDDRIGLTVDDCILAGQKLTGDDDFYLNRLSGKPDAGSFNFTW